MRRSKRCLCQGCFKALLSLFSLTGCLLSCPGYAAKTKQLVYGESGRIDTLDPYTGHETSARRLADLLFNGLVTTSPTGEYRADLASTWQVGTGGTMVRFNLRKDVFWHGGKYKFNAQDVKTTIRLLQDPKSEIPNKERFGLIRSVEIENPSTVVIRLRRATLDPLRVMTFKILPHHLLSGEEYLNRSVKFAKRPVGTGPYLFKKLTNQGELLLEANSNFFKGKPAIKTIILKTYADQSIMAQSLMFNSLDLITYVSPRDISEVLGDRKLSVLPYDALSFTFFGLNTSKGVMRDRRVRQAIAYAVNRQEMLQAFFSGRGKLISGPFPPTSWAYNLNVKNLKHDADRAKQLLETAGLRDVNKDGYRESPKGEELRLLFAVPLAGESEVVKRIVLAFQQYLKNVGLRVDLQFMDWLVWKKKVLEKHNYDVTIGSWSFDDANNITSLFHSRSAQPWGNNFVMFNNQRVDGLLTEAQATNDFDKRRAIYQKLHAILAEETPYVFLWTLTHHAAHNVRLSGVRVEPFAFFKHITSWTVEGD